MKNSLQTLQTDLDALLAGELRSWTKIGYVLNRGDELGYWQKEYGSFTDWLKKLSDSLNLKEASLWRYVSAFRFYKQLHDQLRQRGVVCPAPAELPDSVSPESLELLGKLSRVVPDEHFPALVQRVLTGDITRAELRQTWAAYRPALGGQTARGKGVAVPRVSLIDPQQCLSIVEAEIFTALSSADPKWTGISKPAYFEFFMRGKPVFSEDVSERFEFDAVIMVGASKNSPPIFHGLEIRGMPYYEPVENVLNPRIPYCDYLWIAIPEHFSDRVREFNIPDHVGLMTVRNGVIQVVQFPRQQPNSGTKSGDLAKGLLLRSVRR